MQAGNSKLSVPLQNNSLQYKINKLNIIKNRSNSRCCGNCGKPGKACHVCINFTDVSILLFGKPLEFCGKGLRIFPFFPFFCISLLTLVFQS